MEIFQQPTQATVSGGGGGGGGRVAAILRVIQE